MKLIITCFTLALACSVYAGDGCGSCGKDKKKDKDKKDSKATPAEVTGSKLQGNDTLTVKYVDEKSIRYDGVSNVQSALGRMPGVFMRGR